MSGPINVSVVFDGSRRRKGGAEHVRTMRTTGRAASLLVGMLSLAVCGAMYYGTWWKVDPFIFMTFMLKTPIMHSGVQIPSEGDAAEEPDLGKAAEVMFRISPPGDARSNPGLPPGDARFNPASPATQRWTGEKATAVIGAVGYSWLTLATIGFCALGLAAGACLSAVDGRVIRVGSGVISLALFLGLAAAGLYYWTQYSTGFPVKPFRYGMGGLALAFLFLGMAIGRGGRALPGLNRLRRRRLTRLASFALIVAAAGSAAGLILWNQAGAIEAQYATASFLALVFAVHSVWGWLLLPISFRL